MTTMPDTMTAQEVFDHVWNAMAAQGEPSIVASSCRYRKVIDGVVYKCAAGCLLTDAEADKIPEGVLIDADICLPERLQPHTQLMYALQQAHDNPALQMNTGATWLDLFQVEARKIARQHNLNVPKGAE